MQAVKDTCVAIDLADHSERPTFEICFTVENSLSKIEDFDKFFSDQVVVGITWACSFEKS